MNKTLSIFIFIFFSTVFAFAQEGNAAKIKILQDKIAEVQKLSTKNPDKAFSEIDGLMQEVKKEGYREGELTLLGIQCWYYTNKDLKKAITATQELQQKAEEYESTYYRGIVHEYFSVIYARSELPDKALEESQAAIKLLDQVSDKPKRHDVVMHKVNVYTIANEAYSAKRKYREAVRVLLKANKEIKSLKDSERKQFILKANYTNLAGGYIEFDIDSAEYYVNKSVLLGNGDGQSDIIQFNNHLHLGYIYEKRKDYGQAIISYKKAESQLPYINSTLENVNLIYSGLAEIYKVTDSLEQANIYLQKLQNSLLEQEQNKNKSLHKIIDNELLKEKNYSLYIVIGSVVVIILMLVFLVHLQRKNRQLRLQEKASEHYLNEHPQVKTVDEATLSRLMEMVKNDEDVFMPAFHSHFPSFLEKLRAIHPAIVPSEIEFCALLKLNLSTKDIARYKNIEPKSVQNKKYRIRKKLNIPDDVDIYFWFNKF